ncbi:secreted protein, partial [Candidatus Thiomargarita nelsonii]
MIKNLMLLLLAATFCLPSYANVNFGEYAKFEFAPARGETFLIPIRLEKKASLEISIFTSDGDLVRIFLKAQVGSTWIVPFRGLE